MELSGGRVHGFFQGLDTLSDASLNVGLVRKQVAKSFEGRVVETWHVGAGPGSRTERDLAFVLEPQCATRRAGRAEACLDVWLTVIGVWAFVIAMANVGAAIDVACDL